MFASDPSVDTFSLSKVTLCTGEDLDFFPGEVVLIVGPNNSGKSTFLREIYYGVSDSKRQMSIFSKLYYSGSNSIAIRRRINEHYSVHSDGSSQYVLDKDGSRDFYIGDLTGGPSGLVLGKAADAFVSLMNAEKRLTASHDVATIDPYTTSPSHPFHVFMLDSDRLSSFSKYVEDAFDIGFTITRIGNPIRAFIGEGFSHELSLDADKHARDTGVSLLLQGDGIRSYIGILAGVKTMAQPIILVDEPDAFLHPPQARQLGRTIVQDLEKARQAFIATHSSAFLQGALSALSSRIRVIRISNIGARRTLHTLEKDKLKEAISHPALANSNLLDSLFFSQTVLCEGDADAKMFSGLVTRVGKGKYDPFWFSTGGKHQFGKVARLLHSFGVNWKAILDLDALNNWNLLDELCKMKGFDIEPWKSRIFDALRQPPAHNISESRLEASKVLLSSCDDASAIKLAREVLSKQTSHSTLKQFGIRSISNGLQRANVDCFLQVLKNNGILLLSEGELENYIPSIGLHGPKWLERALNDVTNFENEMNVLATEIISGLFN